MNIGPKIIVLKDDYVEQGKGRTVFILRIYSSIMLAINLLGINSTAKEYLHKDL